MAGKDRIPFVLGESKINQVFFESLIANTTFWNMARGKLFGSPKTMQTFWQPHLIWQLTKFKVGMVFPAILCDLHVKQQLNWIAFFLFFCSLQVANGIIGMSPAQLCANLVYANAWLWFLCVDAFSKLDPNCWSSLSVELINTACVELEQKARIVLFQFQLCIRPCLA